MKINTGRGTIPLITLIGIWSISALTSLPGLAVSPILGQLSTTFPDASELDIQMLSSLPSLLIIPFILLAGKLAEKRDFVRLLRAGLWMFAASGVLYLFSKKMSQLIAVSFRHYKCYAGGGNRCYRLSGRSELASAFPGLFTTFGSHHTHYPSERRKYGW